MKQLIHDVYCTAYQVLLYLFWIEPILKLWNILLFHVRDCRPYYQQKNLSSLRQILFSYLILRISRIYGYLTRYLSKQGTSVKKKIIKILIGWSKHVIFSKLISWVITTLDFSKAYIGIHELFNNQDHTYMEKHT